MLDNKQLIQSEYRDFYEKLQKKLPPTSFELYFNILFNKFLPNHGTLDLGAGQITSIATSKKAIFADISTKAMKESKSLRTSNADFVILDAKRLPFKDLSLDAVVCRDMLEHLPDYHACIKEIIRVTKTNAIVAIAVPRISNAYVEKEWGHLTKFKIEDLKTAFSNFEVIWSETYYIQPWAAFEKHSFFNIVWNFFVRKPLHMILKILCQDKFSYYQKIKKEFPFVTKFHYYSYLYHRLFESKILRLFPSLGWQLIVIFRKKT